MVINSKKKKKRLTEKAISIIQPMSRTEETKRLGNNTRETTRARWEKANLLFLIRLAAEGERDTFAWQKAGVLERLLALCLRSISRGRVCQGSSLHESFRRVFLAHPPSKIRIVFFANDGIPYPEEAYFFLKHCQELA
ncbi:hypothetical protein CEXT_411851 [Caerostris extrusa]|uniref:Uncharacterized protein n=1 Tax=Caerostris extrusa TaxID=172846 RepID=A0AAV4SS53_CAEEX|nr:hypothetical protein CEXT_411851 [Caerostris extrusa]